MRKFQILFLDADYQVVEADSYDVIFKTSGIKEEVIDDVVNLWNETEGVGCLFSGGTLDEHLLNDGRCTTEEKELIIESLYAYARK